MLIGESSKDRGVQGGGDADITNGAAGKIVSRLIRDLILKYHIGLSALLETRINGVKADKVIKNLIMDSWYEVDA
ncbi:hypothetical protein CR513_00070, partial [Mucuna pruriens]